MKFSEVKNFVKDHAAEIAMIAVGVVNVLATVKFGCEYTNGIGDNDEHYAAGVIDGTECCEKVVKAMLPADEYEQFQENYSTEFENQVANQEITAL